LENYPAHYCCFMDNHHYYNIKNNLIMKKLIILPFLVFMLVFSAYCQSRILPAPKAPTGFSQSTTHYTISTPQGIQHGTVQLQTQDLQQMQRIEDFNRQQNEYYQQQLNQTNQSAPVIIIQPDTYRNNSHSSQSQYMYNQSKQINSYPTTNEEVLKLLLRKSGGR
jgi:hypothetical protein